MVMNEAIEIEISNKCGLLEMGMKIMIMSKSRFTCTTPNLSGLNYYYLINTVKKISSVNIQDVYIIKNITY